MTFPIDLEAFAREHAVEEAGYNDEATRHLAQAVRNIEAAHRSLEAQARSGEETEVAKTASGIVHATIALRLETLAEEIGEEYDAERIDGQAIDALEHIDA